MVELPAAKGDDAPALNDARRFKVIQELADVVRSHGQFRAGGQGSPVFRIASSISSGFPSKCCTSVIGCEPSV
jgi:hypothetical protein